MQHYTVSFIGADPSPIGGDIRSWFFYYKFRPGEEGSFYLVLKPEIPLAVGDILWIVMDGVLIGCFPIRSIQEDPFNDRIEFWYDGLDIHPLSIPFDNLNIEELGNIWNQLNGLLSSCDHAS